MATEPLRVDGNLMPMTAQTPKELLRRLFDAINAKHFATLDSLCADDRLREALGRYLTGFPDVHSRLGWIISEGDMVAAWVEMEAK